MATRYLVEYRRYGSPAWSIIDRTEYETMTEAEIAAMDPGYIGLETRVVAVGGSK